MIGAPVARLRKELWVFFSAVFHPTNYRKNNTKKHIKPARKRVFTWF
jgi:hypothetical protein